MNAIIESKERKNLPAKTIFDDMSIELKKELVEIDNIIKMMLNDTYVEEIPDDDNRLIRKTHVNKDLLPWVREKRMFIKDIWKIAGGEIQQEKEKEILKLKGKMIYDSIKEMTPDELAEKFKNWKENKVN